VKENSARRSDRANDIARVVVEVAEELGVPPAQVAINWTRQRNPKLTVLPIVGARTPEQLTDSLGCLKWTLPDDALQTLNDASAIELGFPHDFLASDGVKDVLFGGTLGKIKP